MLKHIRPKHIRGGATRPRAKCAGSLWDGADIRQGHVADALWGTTRRRRPLLAPIGLTGANICSRHDGKMNLNRPQSK